MNELDGFANVNVEKGKVKGRERGACLTYITGPLPGLLLIGTLLD
jgi:hypothetical protein